MVLAGLALLSCGPVHAQAEAIVAGLAQLFLLGLLLVASALVALGYAIAKWRGVAAVAAILGAAATCFAINQTRIASGEEQIARLELLAHQTACAQNARREIYERPDSFGKIYLIDEIKADLWSRGDQIDKTRLLSNVSMLASDASRDDPQAIYVALKSIDQRIEGSPHARLRGIIVTIYSGHGKLIAKLIDYYARDYYWCLGSKPPILIEDFVESAIGKPILRPETPERQLLRPSAPINTPKISPNISEETGRFVQSGPGNAELEERGGGYRGNFWAPPGVDCAPNSGYEGNWICLKGSPKENLVRQAQPIWHLIQDGRWFLADFPSHPGPLRWIRLEERSMDGTLKAIWHLRFPPGAYTSRYGNYLLDMRLDHSKLQIRLGTDLPRAPPSEGACESVVGCFEFHRRVSVIAELVSEFDASGRLLVNR